jgi:hypothetical protein
MDTSKPALEDHLEDALDALDRRNYSWREDLIDVESVPTPLYNTAKAFEQLGRTAALYGAVEQSHRWFGEAARFHHEQIRAYRLRRDMRSRRDWASEPRRFVRALNAALLSHDEQLIEEIATDALGMDECYLDEFADEYTEFPTRYYNVKVKAARALDDTDYAKELLDSLETEIERTDGEGQFWRTLPTYYRSLVDGVGQDAQAAVDEIVEYYTEEHPDPDGPKHFVLDAACAAVVLARRHGLDVWVDSERLPPALLRKEVPDDDMTLDIDLSGLTFKSDVGLFELERDDDGTPVIAGRIYHPGGREVTAEDVPEREAGRVLSDEWVEAALDEASWRDQYDDDLVADAKEAFDEGTLVRKLVVVQDRTDGGLFDDSLTEPPIDDIELMKGAGKRT